MNTLIKKFLVIFLLLCLGTVVYSQEENQQDSPKKDFIFLTAFGFGYGYSLYQPKIDTPELRDEDISTSTHYIGLSTQTSLLLANGIFISFPVSFLFGIDTLLTIKSKIDVGTQGQDLFPTDIRQTSTINLNKVIANSAIIDFGMLFGYAFNFNNTFHISLNAGPSFILDFIKTDEVKRATDNQFYFTGKENDSDMFKIGLKTYPQVLVSLTKSNSVFLIVGADMNFSFYHKSLSSNTQSLYGFNDTSTSSTTNKDDFSFLIFPKIEIALRPL